jgi:hypothetical protein
MNSLNRPAVFLPITAIAVAAVVFAGIYLKREPLRGARSKAVASGARVATVTLRHDDMASSVQHPNRVSPEPEQSSIDFDILNGLVPYQDDGTLSEMGVTSQEAKERTNRLFAGTFFALVDAMAKHAEVQLNQPDHLVLISVLDQATRDQLRAQFYAGLKDIIGQAKFDELVSKGSIELVEHGMLGFGDLPVVIDLRPPPAGERKPDAVRLTFSTQFGDPATWTAAYAVSQAIPMPTFDRNFEALRVAAKSSSFRWPGSGS